MQSSSPQPAAEALALAVFIKLNRACMEIDRRVHSGLRDFGLTGIQLGVLDAIHFGGPLPITVIAEKNLCSQNSMCTVIDTMERNGLVRRVRSAQDRRVVNVELTESGAELFNQIWPAHVDRIVEAVSHMDPAELDALNGLLRKLGKGSMDKVALGA